MVRSVLMIGTSQIGPLESPVWIAPKSLLQGPPHPDGVRFLPVKRRWESSYSRVSDLLLVQRNTSGTRHYPMVVFADSLSCGIITIV